MTTDNWTPPNKRGFQRRRKKAKPPMTSEPYEGVALGNVRALRALNMRRNGHLLDDIAKEFGVTRERARQMVALGAEIERRMISTDPWDELNIRIRNALTRDGCKPTAESVVEHFKTRDWKHVPAFGKKALAELNVWLVQHGKEPIPVRISKAPLPSLQDT